MSMLNNEEIISLLEISSVIFYPIWGGTMIYLFHFKKYDESSPKYGKWYYNWVVYGLIAGGVLLIEEIVVTILVKILK